MGKLFGLGDGHLEKWSPCWKLRGLLIYSTSADQKQTFDTKIFHLNDCVWTYAEKTIIDGHLENGGHLGNSGG